MNTHLIAPFTKWLVKKMFGGFANLYSKYDEIVVDNPGLAIMPTFLICVFYTAVCLILLAISKSMNSSSIWIVPAGSFLIFGNYFRIILREQYEKFKSERQELFNILKD